ncbi:MAG: GxxExxY protein, partial [Planctomycetota bacterium]
EKKSATDISPIHKQQLLSYLRLNDVRLGLLINFNVLRLVDGIYRVVNGLKD